jgi:hypothetical protein
MMLVRFPIVTHYVDVLTLLCVVVIMTFVLLMGATLKMGAITMKLTVMTVMPVPRILVIQKLDVFIMKYSAMIMTNVQMTLVTFQLAV